MCCTTSKVHITHIPHPICLQYQETFDGQFLFIPWCRQSLLTYGHQHSLYSLKKTKPNGLFIVSMSQQPQQIYMLEAPDSLQYSPEQQVPPFRQKLPISANAGIVEVCFSSKNFFFLRKSNLFKLLPHLPLHDLQASELLCRYH